MDMVSQNLMNDMFIKGGAVKGRKPGEKVSGPGGDTFDMLMGQLAEGMALPAQGVLRDARGTGAFFAGGAFLEAAFAGAGQSVSPLSAGASGAQYVKGADVYGGADGLPTGTHFARAAESAAAYTGVSASKGLPENNAAQSLHMTEKNLKAQALTGGEGTRGASLPEGASALKGAAAFEQTGADLSQGGIKNSAGESGGLNTDNTDAQRGAHLSGQKEASRNTALPSREKTDAAGKEYSAAEHTAGESADLRGTQTSHAAQTAQTTQTVQTAQASEHGKEPLPVWEIKNSPEDMLRLADLADKAAASKGGTLEVRLEPEQLGKIVIRAAYEEGKASVEISCLSGKSAEMISKHAGELGSILQERMGGTTEISVTRQAEQTQDGSQSQSQGKEPWDDGNRHGGREQKDQEERGRRQSGRSQDFLQQLRLGIA